MELKKGVFFTLDSFLAVSVLLFTVFIISSSYTSVQEPAQSYQKSSDLVKVLTSIEVDEIDNQYVQDSITSGDITRLNNSLIEQIGEFWATGQQDKARELVTNLSYQLIPSQFGFSVYIDDELIYSNNKPLNTVLASSSKIISGIGKDKPTDGFTSRAYLTSVQDKVNTRYAYFGGFVGQGNLSVFIDQIPSGVTLTGLEMEVDAGDDFNLFVNGQQCETTFSPSTGQMNADRWNLSTCMSDLVTGQQNNFSLEFPSGISNAFIGGGFVKVSYVTSEFQSSAMVENYTQVWLPDIHGIINLFSSLYAPGIISNFEAVLHFSAESDNTTNTFYMTIGNTTVLRIPNATGEQTIVLNNSNLSSQLQYASLGEQTIPLRVGFENVTFSSIFEGNGDVALITDVSGSMDWRMDVDNIDGAKRNCDDSSLNDSDTQRLSIAKCLDKQFVDDIINISGNKLGLISYESSTVSGETVNPTTDRETLLTTIGNASPETGYTAGGGTCICCGINSAASMLNAELATISLISSGSTWTYTDSYLDTTPANDPSNNTWYAYTYANETSWSSASAILGATNGYSYSPTVTTELAVDFSGSTLYGDLWEHGTDTAGAPNDFTSGILNSTANTYGIGGADDGWDNDNQDGSGPFGHDDNIDYNGIVGGKLQFDNNDGGSGNICSSDDCSGAYGILVNITAEMYTMISGGGDATVTFEYDWDDRSGNVFEPSDQVWIKSRWTSPTSGEHYLGTDLDSGHSNGDSDFDVATADNPDNDFSGTYAQDISSWIEGEGMYYLEIGGKIRASQSQEYGTWEFDNIELVVRNATNHYYFRRDFTIADITQARKAIINILSDDRAFIYVNGNLVDSDFVEHEGEYWNKRGIPIDGSILQQGTNVIAVEVLNTGQAAKFDLEMIGLNDSRDKAMMVMTDGQATEDAGCPQSGSASEEAIQAACEAREDYGIAVYAVGFSDAADETTLESIAACGEGLFAASNNVSVLEEFYKDVAASIVSASRQSQTIEVQGSISESRLFGDSYIALNYSSTVDSGAFDEIELNFEQKGFQNCSLNVTIPSQVRVVEAQVTSYSSEHWTDLLIVNDQVVYNLSDYSEDYTTLGDPFTVSVPPNVLQAGNNSFVLKTGDIAENSTGCSANNSVIYTGMVESSVTYGQVLESAEGCQWSVETEDNGFISLSIPSGYSGTNTCSFNATGTSYNTQDSIDVAVFNLLTDLDFDGDHRIDINIAQEDLEIEALFLSDVPSLWGPTVVEIRVWE